MGKKRRLGDLYRTYRIVDLDDGGEKISVAMVKINRPDTDASALAANAHRSRMLMRRNDKESDLWLEAWGEIAERDRDDLVRVLTADDLAQKRLSAEAEEAAQDRWDEDGYLDGLRQLWNDELMDTWAVHPDDPDAKRVYDELDAFRDAVAARMSGQEKDLAEGYAHIDLDELRVKVTNKLIENSANVAWINEFETQRVFFATRDPNDRSKRYFESVDEVKDLDDRIYTMLRMEYDDLAMDVVSGKASRENPASSPPSGPSAEEEHSKDSGPVESNASRTFLTNS